ncbi:RNA exonuclease 1 homolog isoform X2 [Vicugna pacos]|uniref:RNA exonuclease 1 homolog isoform X2 n=1 Tax=Vicugna pacos TaxID=30538 RepID=A0ABM5D3B1_VICPA
MQALGAPESSCRVPGEAKIEEKAIYEHCGSQNMYMNIAINTLKKLREQDVSGSSDDKTTGLKTNKKENVLTGIILYRHLKDYLLTEEQLHENNYPQPNPDKPGSVLLNPGMTRTLVNDGRRGVGAKNTDFIWRVSRLRRWQNNALESHLPQLLRRSTVDVGKSMA